MDAHGFGHTQTASLRNGLDEYAAKKATEISSTPKPTAKEKQRFLSSNLEGHDAHAEYQRTKNYPVAGDLVDIDLSGLPENADELSIKRIANVKHVINTEVQENPLKGTCTGQGRIKLRLNDGESAEQVQLNFQRAGYTANFHLDDPRKKPELTGPKKDTGEHRFFNAKQKKAYEMSTKERQLA